MRLDNDDIRAMPLHMQERLGLALAMKIQEQLGAVPVAQAIRLDQAIQVAGGEKRPKEKTPVRRLHFRTARAAQRYRELRILARTGIISDLVLSMDGEYVRSFTYLVVEEV